MKEAMSPAVPLHRPFGFVSGGFVFACFAGDEMEIMSFVVVWTLRNVPVANRPRPRPCFVQAFDSVTLVIFINVAME